MLNTREIYSFKTAIIDLDPIVYRCGFSTESLNRDMDILEVEPMSHAIYNMNHMIDYCLQVSDTKAYRGFLTGKGNFRHAIFKEYKANRKDARRPYWYDELRSYLMLDDRVTTVDGQEADDACSIAHCRENNYEFHPDIRNSIVWSVDKDFNNIPGWHGNYVTKEIYYVDEIEALRNFYLQILTGDIADGIPRIKKGWRQKETEKELKEAATENEFRRIVHSVIKSTLEPEEDSSTSIEEKVREILTDRGQLVWLRRKEGELWT